MCCWYFQDFKYDDIFYLSSFERFTSHLKHRKLTEVQDNPKLKGVSSAISFSGVAYRRYFDHVLAYTNFKEASKSDDKHRLYLGLLNGPIYPEAVVLLFRERLLNQVECLCEDLKRSIPYKELEVAALLPPIEGDPFDLEEVCISSILLCLRLVCDHCSCTDEGLGFTIWKKSQF
jgi:hypothetical protein